MKTTKNRKGATSRSSAKERETSPRGLTNLQGNGNGHNGKKGHSSMRMHRTHNDLPVKVRETMIHLLNQTLAETLDIYSQTKQAHWNVKGVHFYQLHLLFDELAEELLEYVDLVAERATSLGGIAMGTVRMSARASQIPEMPIEIAEGMHFVAALVDRFSEYAHHVRHNIEDAEVAGDLDTSDIFTQISRGIDMRLWFLEAHLQSASASREAPVARLSAKPKR